MTVDKLIKRLELIKDKTLNVKLESRNWTDEDTNYWICDIELSKTGSSGYEQAGEVRLIGEE